MGNISWDPGSTDVTDDGDPPWRTLTIEVTDETDKSATRSPYSR